MWSVEQGDYSKRQYIAPTVYMLGARPISNWNYYNNFWDAVKKWQYINSQGGSNIQPAGLVSFTNNGSNQTMGINVDFYILRGGLWELSSYGYIRSVISNPPPCIYRFYTTAGSGPYYGIFNNYHFGISATTVQDYTPEKLAALDLYYREVQLMKYRYNSFVGFVNTLGKKEMNAQEAKIYNDGLKLMESFTREMKTVRSIELEYGQGAKIGALPVIAVIAIIAVLSAAAGWTVTAILNEREKTKRINDAYELNKWVADKKTALAQMVEVGTISQENADGVIKTLDAAAATALKVADNAGKSSKSIFGDMADIVKYGAIGVIGYMLLKNKGQKNAV